MQHSRAKIILFSSLFGLAVLIGASVMFFKQPDMTGRKRIVCLGDSITWGSRLDFFRWTTHLQKKLDKQHPKQWHVINAGINGNTSEMILKRANDVLALNPTLVILQMGFNDAHVLESANQPRVTLDDFAKHLTQIVNLFEDADIPIAIVLNHPVDHCNIAQGNGVDYAQNYAPYQATLRSFCERKPIPIIDMPNLLEQQQVDMTSFLREDGLHLTHQGNRIYAKLMNEALKNQGLLQTLP
ncbi:MAG: SGNH/GDSL hydrolase family protein [Phycisphaeraceae bacterium JB051]